MASTFRLIRTAARLLTDRKYRNRVLQLIDHQAPKEPAESNGKLGAAGASDREFLKGKRLFVAAGCDQTFVVDYLEGLGLKVCHSYSLGRPSDPLTEVMTPGSRSVSEPWDYYLLSVAQVLRSLIRRIQIAGMEYSREEAEKDLEVVLDNYRGAITRIREHSQAPIFLFSYLLSYLPTFGLHEYRSVTKGWSLIEFWHLYHLRLYELAREFPSVYVFDADQAVADAGKLTVIDPLQSNGIFDHPSREGARVLGDRLVRHLSTLDSKRRRIKCAVFDLDGTLWAGVLREDGATGVAVQEYYLNVLEKLSARGILLAVCSKNDPAELDLLSGLLGEEVHSKIVSFQLSWEPKSKALREIAEELNIGLDSLAFFDDSAFERAEVATNAPEVLVLTPDDIFSCVNRPEFQPVGEITHETLSRTVKYQQQAKRKVAERSSSMGIEDFLRSCELQLELQLPKAGEMSRVFELLQRTNQLNATLTRTSIEQLKAQFDNPEQYFMRTARLRDRFGDYGLIGFASARKDKDHWQVLDLAFSCRSAARGVEQAMLSLIAAAARSCGARSLRIRFVLGPRNHQMLAILKQSGFLSPADAPLSEGETVDLVRPIAESPHSTMPEWLKVDTGEESIDNCLESAAKN